MPQISGILFFYRRIAQFVLSPETAIDFLTTGHDAIFSFLLVLWEGMYGIRGCDEPKRQKELPAVDMRFCLRGR